jgi:spore maturation protein CgeB
VGNPGKHHLGAHFIRAAQRLGLEATLCDTTRAYEAPVWVRRVAWHLLGHRPARLDDFGQSVVQICKEFRPTWLLSTGIVPLSASVLKSIGQMGIQRLNFLTDDPWSPSQRATWFLKALAYYDRLYTPRHANQADLQQASKAEVTYLPFGYEPTLHFRPSPPKANNGDTPVLFVGGADADRVPFIGEAIERGLSPTLVGGYWAQHAATKPYARGHVDADILRTLTANAINICLVRRANRDGHVMRSFEIPACGGAMLAEDTADHRALFGAEGEAVLYFDSVSALVAKAKMVQSDRPLRHRLSTNAHHLLHTQPHTYQHRLETMLDFA